MRLQDTSSSRIMIVGGGKIGSALAKGLEDDYKIKIIDPDKDRCEVLSRELNRTIVLKGAGSDEELLKSENIENIDIFCALTNDDETNIMSAFLAKKLGAKKTIIIVNNYTYINILPKNFVDIALSPQRLTVSMVLQHLLPLPDGCVIAAVIRADEVYMHSKNLLLKPNDKIIVFILGKTDKEKIENLFLTD